MTPSSPSRRRFLGIVAASGALLGSTTLHAALRTPGLLPEPVIWRGIALGADAQLQILHPDRNHAQAMVRQAVAEVHRLEAIFSLYQPDSALSRLNREGRLHLPPADLCDLLTRALAFCERTRGYFDPSVQPLWDLYAQRVHSGQPLPPPPSMLHTALARVDWRAIRLTDEDIVLERPGMALTLNGIAQGYITDRVTDLLHSQGLEHALVDMGEARSLGVRAANRPWRAGIADPAHPERILHVLDLHNRALATSGGYGTYLDESGQHTHLFNPLTGHATPRWRSVSVLAADATTADALSTAFTHMHGNEIHATLRSFPARAWLVPYGTRQVVTIAGLENT